METTLFKITTKDGRIFKVFCANKHQKDRFIKSTFDIRNTIIKTIDPIENGIHDIKQWEKWIEYLPANKK